MKSLKRNARVAGMSELLVATKCVFCRFFVEFYCIVANILWSTLTLMQRSRRQTWRFSG